MHLKHLSLIQFKNYPEADLHFSEKINCFTGNNGVGKTNLLDAIHFLSFCKSAFNPNDSQHIYNDTDFFMIQGLYERKGFEELIQCGVKRGQKKSVKRNKKEYNSLSEHIGLLPLVMKSPADSDFIHLGSEERRKFPDTVISQFDPAYLSELIQYNRLLQHRNKLLKQGNAGQNASIFEVLNEQMNEYANEIHRKRSEFITNIIPVFQQYYTEISIGREEVKLQYESHLNDSDFLDLLRDSFSKDTVLQYTTKGIHRDDLNLLINEQAIRRFGSQGQQKTFLVALKLAQYQYIKEKTGLKPILLLDDLFDKLDSDRVERIIHLVTKNDFGQIFITDTNPERISHLLMRDSGNHHLFRIEPGKVIEQQ